MIDREDLLHARSDNLCRLARALGIDWPESMTRERLVTVIRARMKRAEKRSKR